MKTKKLSLVLIPVLAYFSALPSSQAVMPPPDGGYPGFNTAEGQNALFSLATGVANTGLAGIRSLATPTAATTLLSARGRSFST